MSKIVIIVRNMTDRQITVRTAAISTFLSAGLFILLPLFQGKFSSAYLGIAIANWLLCFFAGTWFSKWWRRQSRKWDRDTDRWKGD